MSQRVNDAGAPPETGSTFRSRLFHYSIGLTIGCVMTGALISARHKAAAARAQAEAAQAAEWAEAEERRAVGEGASRGDAAP